MAKKGTAPPQINKKSEKKEQTSRRRKKKSSRNVKETRPLVSALYFQMLGVQCYYVWQMYSKFRRCPRINEIEGGQNQETETEIVTSEKSTEFHGKMVNELQQKIQNQDTLELFERFVGATTKSCNPIGDTFRQTELAQETKSIYEDRVQLSCDILCKLFGTKDPLETIAFLVTWMGRDSLCDTMVGAENLSDSEQSQNDLSVENSSSKGPPCPVPIPDDFIPGFVKCSYEECSANAYEFVDETAGAQYHLKFCDTKKPLGIGLSCNPQKGIYCANKRKGCSLEVDLGDSIIGFNGKRYRKMSQFLKDYKESPEGGRISLLLLSKGPGPSNLEVPPGVFSWQDNGTIIDDLKTESGRSLQSKKPTQIKRTKGTKNEPAYNRRKIKRMKTKK